MRERNTAAEAERSANAHSSSIAPQRAAESAGGVAAAAGAGAVVSAAVSMDKQSEGAAGGGNNASPGVGHWSGGGGARPLGALEAAAEEEATIRVLIAALPRVSLHVLIQHRVELLPLFQRAIARCPVPTHRVGVTALLFSLIKRPGPDQRRALADACANIAKVRPRLSTLPSPAAAPPPAPHLSRARSPPAAPRTPFFCSSFLFLPFFSGLN